jgi:hypothetical protein
MVLCVVTRTVTKMRAAQAVINVTSMAEHDAAFVQLRPLDEVSLSFFSTHHSHSHSMLIVQSARERYAVQVMSDETHQEVRLAAMPPVLLQLLSDRAAGNPKHIQEMVKV